LDVLINTTGGGAVPPTPTALPAPALLSPADKAKLPLNQSIPFSWSAVAGAATYEIQFDDSSSFSAPLVAQQTGLTQTQTTQTFTSERRYWWRVRGRIGGVLGAWSATRFFDVKKGAVPPPSPTSTPTAVVPTATILPPTATLPPSPTVVLPTATQTAVLPTATSALPTVTPSQAPATPTAALDTVSIQKAEYSAGNQELRVEATGSNTGATLTVYVSATNTLIGTLSNDGGGRYRGEFDWPTNPQNITVRSSLGGSATRAVTLK
jgi:hypothetical protein